MNALRADTVIGHVLHVVNVGGSPTSDVSGVLGQAVQLLNLVSSSLICISSFVFLSERVVCIYPVYSIRKERIHTLRPDRFKNRRVTDGRRSHRRRITLSQRPCSYTSPKAQFQRVSSLCARKRSGAAMAKHGTRSPSLCHSRLPPLPKQEPTPL